MWKHHNKRAALVAGLSAIAIAACWPAGDAGALAKSKKRDEARKLEQKPILPPGPLLIVVSINTQRATLYADGIPVAHSAISTGTPGHPTPMGVFTVIQKDLHHWSNLYAAAMPYMQRITWSGAALHQGPLPGFPASHGCIRLTAEFAQLLWKVTKLGVRVIVTKPDAAPVEIANAHLFAPKPKVAEIPRIDPPPAALDATLVKTADASATTPIVAAASAETVGAAKIDVPIVVETVLPPERPHVTGPISMLVSRKEAKLYVRQGTHPLFDMPVTIKSADQPIGTHVYTATALKDGGTAMRWNVISIPSSYPHAIKAKLASKGKHKNVAPIVVEPGPAPSASEALDRLELPQDAIDRIDALITPGSSLIVSDNKLSDETDRDTDLIVTTR